MTTTTSLRLIGLIALCLSAVACGESPQTTNQTDLTPDAGGGPMDTTPAEGCASGTQDNDDNGTCEEDCASAAPLDCGYGTCTDASGTVACECDAAYDGPHCSACATDYQDNDTEGTCERSCAITACVHGTCDDASGAAICECEDGYDGDACDVCATGFKDFGDDACNALDSLVPEDGLIAFVTSEKYNGNLGGKEGADAKCQAAANAVGLTGTFLAVSSPYARVPFVGLGPWYRLDGLKVKETFHNTINLGSLVNTLSFNELGDELVFSRDDRAWVGYVRDCDSYGCDAIASYCSEWQSIDGAKRGGYGSPFATNADWWLNNSGDACDIPHRLFCFEVIEE